jgi:hypothetical protein
MRATHRLPDPHLTHLVRLFDIAVANEDIRRFWSHT